MKKCLLLLCLLQSNFLLAQWAWQSNNFEDNNNLDIVISEGAEEIWQIGPPDKVLFDAAHTVPNAIVTQLSTAYPNNAEASFELEVEGYVVDEWFPFIQIEWYQQIDVEEGGDGGTIEASYDGGETWHNIFDSPVFRPLVVGAHLPGELHNGHQGFTGTLGWQWVAVCWGSYQGEVPENVESVKMRFTFISDDNQTFQEGWMMDGFTVPNAFVIGSIEDFGNRSLSLFPNPVSNELFVSNGMDSPDQNTLEIFDFSGRLVLKQEFWMSEMYSIPVDVSDLAPGKYLAILTNSDRQRRSSFVKN